MDGNDGVETMRNQDWIVTKLVPDPRAGFDLWGTR